MKLIDVLKGKGYNPYRGAGGRFASGSGGTSTGSSTDPVLQGVRLGGSRAKSKAREVDRLDELDRQRAEAKQRGRATAKQHKPSHDEALVKQEAAQLYGGTKLQAKNNALKVLKQEHKRRGGDIHALTGVFDSPSPRAKLALDTLDALGLGEGVVGLMYPSRRGRAR